MGCGASASPKKYEAVGAPEPKPKEGQAAVKVPSKDAGSPAVKRDSKIDRSAFLVTMQGKVEDEYEVVGRPLGEGAFGAVYKCKHKQDGHLRAVKKIEKKRVRNKAALEREVALQKGLDHPNICKIYGALDDGRYYSILMEYCSGGDLFDKIVEASRFSEKIAAGLVRQMILALIYMHAENVAHRDLKPENYLLANKEGLENTVLKLVDFGMSRTFDREKPMRTYVCTPFYVAPEILATPCRYTYKCDMWSLGVIIYVMLSGRPPFRPVGAAGANNEEAVLRAVTRGVYNFHAPEWQRVSKEAKDLIGQLLVLKPDQRLEAADALKHPWIEGRAPGADALLSDEAFHNLKSFHTHVTFKKTALAILTKYVDDAQGPAAELRKVFQSMDKDGDGTLGYDEVIKGIERAGHLTAEDRSHIMMSLDAIDSDGSGKIDYSEFLAATLGDRTAKSTDGQLREVFNQFDVDHSGVISKDNLAFVLSGGVARSLSTASSFVQDEVQAAIESADMNDDGEIDFEEFVAMLRAAADTKPLPRYMTEDVARQSVATEVDGD